MSLTLEEKVVAWYAKMKSEFKGPVHKMVMETHIKEYEEYFGIKLKKNDKEDQKV